MAEAIELDGVLHYPIEQASKKAGLSQKQFGKYVAKGFAKPSAIRGRRYYYSDKAIDDFLRRKMQKEFSIYEACLKRRMAKYEAKEKEGK